MDISRYVELHMFRRATDEQIEILNEDLEAWRRELIKILNRAMADRQAIAEKAERDMEKYADDQALQEKAFLAWQEKALQASHRIRRAEYDLALVDQARHVELDPPMTPRERFLTAAIEAHREITLAPRDADTFLWEALDGKWSFTSLPEGDSWLE